MGVRLGPGLVRAAPRRDNKKYMNAVAMYDSGVPLHKVMIMTGVCDGTLRTYLRFFSERYQDGSYWTTQKLACQAFGDALAEAGARKFTAGPDEFDRPRLTSARVEISGCSCSLGWD